MKTNRSPGAEKIFEPGPYDVLCGRGCVPYNNIGNRRFRVTIALNLETYKQSSSRMEKSMLIISIVKMIRANGGRFLKKKGGAWVDIGDKLAREKVGHALRDMSVNYAPGVSTLSLNSKKRSLIDSTLDDMSKLQNMAEEPTGKKDEACQEQQPADDGNSDGDKEQKGCDKETEDSVKIFMSKEDGQISETTIAKVMNPNDSSRHPTSDPPSTEHPAVEPIGLNFFEQMDEVLDDPEVETSDDPQVPPSPFHRTMCDSQLPHSTIHEDIANLGIPTNTSPVDTDQTVENYFSEKLDKFDMCNSASSLPSFTELHGKRRYLERQRRSI